jgi:predicted nuclease with TOPRIM domain
MLIRDRSASGYDLALVTTDTDATPRQIIETIRLEVVG